MSCVKNLPAGKIQNPVPQMTARNCCGMMLIQGFTIVLPCHILQCVIETGRLLRDTALAFISLRIEGLACKHSEVINVKCMHLNLLRWSLYIDY